MRLRALAMGRTGAVVLVAVAVAVAVAGCQASGDAEAPASSDEEPSSAPAPQAPPTRPMVPGGEVTGAEETEASTEEASAAPRAADCVPGTWDVDMPSFVATFQTPGKPRYRDGSYTFTFDANYGYSAVGDDVTFRIRSSEGFVDVHNSWTEEGVWGAANETSTFDEALVILGYPGDITAAEVAVILDADEEELVAVVGSGYATSDNYGMVNGTIRTPPLSDEGAAITGVGDVDCAAGTMTLYVSDDGWSGGIDLTRR